MYNVAAMIDIKKFVNFEQMFQDILIHFFHKGVMKIMGQIF